MRGGLDRCILFVVRRRRVTVSKFRLITSAVGTTLLQSPGGNEGKARNETLGKHGYKNKSSEGAALSARAFAFV